MQSGTDFEPLALAMYAVTMQNVAVTKEGFLVHPAIDWIGGSPDGMVLQLFSDNMTVYYGGVEAKCPVNAYDGIPPYYMPQLQGLMEITNRWWWDFAVWTPDSFTVTRVYRSPQYWEALYELLCEFWTYIEADVEPPKFARGSKPSIKVPLNTQLLHKE